MRYYVYGFRGRDEFFATFRWSSLVGSEIARRRNEGWTVHHREAPCALQ